MLKESSPEFLLQTYYNVILFIILLSAENIPLSGRKGKKDKVFLIFIFLIYTLCATFAHQHINYYHVAFFFLQLPMIIFRNMADKTKQLCEVHHRGHRDGAGIAQ